jgi:hypothetical protein
MAAAPRLITLEFLKWVALRPRTYADVQAAWRSTCPLTCAWEDALADDLVTLAGSDGRAPASVLLTPAGRALVDGAVQKA